MKTFLSRMPKWLVITAGVVVVGLIWAAALSGGAAAGVVGMLATAGAARKGR